MGSTLAEKLWASHLVRSAAGEPDLLYIDMHLIHEVTSPQAFDGLRLAGRGVRRPELTLATEDHNVPTTDLLAPIADPVSRIQVETLRRNCEEFGIALYPMGHSEQGIVHVIGPQLGITQPGMTLGLRRFAHLDPRRVRCAGVRDRNQPGRARAGHPDPAAGASQDDGGDRRGAAAARRHAQGSDPGADRAGRHRRRSGLHGGVPRRGLPADEHGGPDDRVQHEHRVGRPGRADRPGPDHLRLPARASACADRGRLGRRGAGLDEPGHRPRRGVRRRDSPGSRRHQPVRHLGNQPRAGRAAVGPGAGPGRFRHRVRAGVG